MTLSTTSPDCIMPDTCVNMAKATGIGNMGNVVQHSLYQKALDETGI